MSPYLNILRSDDNAAPISLEAWLAAARQVEALVVTERTDRAGRTLPAVHLEGDPRARLVWNSKGVIYAQNPSPSLAAVMFELAAALEAGVYGERGGRFVSVESWARRTRRARLERDVAQAAARASARVAQRRRRTLWLVVVLIAALLGWLTAPPW